MDRAEGTISRQRDASYQESGNDEEDGDSIVTALKENVGELGWKQRSKPGCLDSEKIITMIKHHEQDRYAAQRIDELVPAVLPWFCRDVGRLRGRLASHPSLGGTAIVFYFGGFCTVAHQNLFFVRVFC